MTFATPEEEEAFWGAHPDLDPGPGPEPSLRSVRTNETVSVRTNEPTSVRTYESVDDADPEKTSHQHFGQARYAYRLAASHGDRLMHVHQMGWFWYDGKRWVEDDQGYAKRAVLAELRRAWTAAFGDDKAIKEIVRLQSASSVEGILRLAEALEQFAFTVNQLDADPHLLNTTTGTLDLRTLVVRPHDYRDRITKMTRGAYSPTADATRWEAFLARSLPDPDVRAFLRRLAGVALLGEVREHVLPILTGTGANGKGVFYGALAWALDEYGVIPEPDLLMARDHAAHTTGLLDLRGRRLAVISESDEGRKLAESTMKRLTGGDPITGRRMHRDNVTFEPSHTALFVTNHLPRVRGDDPAIWRRLRVIPFDVVIPEAERDAELPGRLRDDADAVLTWAVAGLRDYLDRGKLGEPEAVIKRTEEYKLDSDAVSRFVAECCFLSSAAHVASGDLFERWCKWSVEDGADHLSAKALGQELDKRGFPAARTHVGRVRKGLGLLTEDDEEEVP